MRYLKMAGLIVLCFLIFGCVDPKRDQEKTTYIHDVELLSYTPFGNDRYQCVVSIGDTVRKELCTHEHVVLKDYLVAYTSTGIHGHWVLQIKTEAHDHYEWVTSCTTGGALDKQPSVTGGLLGGVGGVVVGGFVGGDLGKVVGGSLGTVMGSQAGSGGSSEVCVRTLQARVKDS